MKKLLVSVLAMAALVGSGMVQSAAAADFIGPDGDRGNVTIAAESSYRNLYTAGGDVLINSSTTGDMHAAGGKVIVDGTVEDDAVIAAGEVTLNGAIGGDVRAAGGTVTITSAVAGDVIVFGGTVRLTDKASVGGDLVIAGGEVILDAPVEGTARINGGTAIINNRIGGELKAETTDRLTFGSKAVVTGKISYKGYEAAEVQNGAQVSSIDFQQMERKDGVGKKLAAILTLGFVIKLLAGIITALVLWKLFPQTTNHLMGSIEQKPWVNVGIGFLALVVAPIGVVLLFVTFVGYYAALIVLFAYILLLLLASLVSAVFTGAWIVKKLTKKDVLVVDWQAVVIGVVVLAIIKFVPFIGMLVIFLLMLMAFGAFIRLLKNRITTEQGQAEIVTNN